ncbi:PRC-barrel domain-containing protein [Neomoorella thermoacetica]|uniref:PRC-barrel domain-containing protein n=1 Tax=Neomoorella thermoacetica TaxID=1525 RepID=UPI0008FADC81|nr:PRC-barrel domain-containing protein [Moorella thermoacetica]OIQ55210.1 PRC-barrel domain protein [Moorella thermoacetica]OIQ59643.1 PRC-barrel domain protein [Moorella thermoacetica]
MPKGRELVGLPVISQDRGEELGRIQDLFYDETSGSLRACLLADGGWLRQPRVVDFTALQARGPGAFTVSGAGAISHEPPPGTRRWQELKGLRLLNRDGRELGIVEDLVVELPSGQVKALEISTGLVNDLLEGRKEITLEGQVNWGTDTVIIG